MRRHHCHLFLRHPCRFRRLEDLAAWNLLPLRSARTRGSAVLFAPLPSVSCVSNVFGFFHQAAAAAAAAVAAATVRAMKPATGMPALPSLPGLPLSTSLLPPASSKSPSLVQLMADAGAAAAAVAVASSSDTPLDISTAVASVASVTGQHVCPHPECGLSFPTGGMLITHKRQIHLHGAYACESCSKSFPNAVSLAMHAKLHTGICVRDCALALGVLLLGG